jgi:imidazolonepropionase-like amidohydrolase
MGKKSLGIWLGCLLFMAGTTWAADEPVLLIENVTLIDGTGRPAIRGAYVLVEGERVSAVSPDPLTAPDSAARIDGKDLYLIPGLIDSHIHLPGGRTGPGNREMIMDTQAGLEVLHGYLYSGVTSIYDSGNHGEFVRRMRADERAGNIVSPRIFATIKLIAPRDGHGCCAGGIVVENFQDGTRTIDDLLQFQPDLLKFTREARGMGAAPRNIPLMPADLLGNLITYANQHGLRTTVHVSSLALAREAVAAGASALAHTVYLDEVDSAFANLLASRNVTVSTTIIRNVADVSFYDAPLFQALMTPEERAEAKGNPRYVGPEVAAWRRSLRPTMLSNIRRLHAAGVTLAMGTDRSIGAAPHEELGLIVEAGISPLEALRMATLNAAVYIGVEDTLGSIEPGKLADMVLLRRDPTVDISNTQSIAAVFKGGQRIARSKLNVLANAE